MSLLIAADVVPQKINSESFKNANLDDILGEELNKIWSESKYKIFNLEAPITYSDNPIFKCGPNLKISPKCIKGIKALDPTLILLSNNHIMDFGNEGLEDTIKYLKEQKVEYIGVGNNQSSVIKSYSIIENRKTITFYNCCENEFSTATDTEPGANQFDSLCTYDEIKELKEKCDFLIILYHGGKEHYRYPSLELKKRCEKMIDSGANLVVCQHSHCIGCLEEYNSGKIIYGQGNFIFVSQGNEYWQTSLILDIDIESNFKINYIPIMQTDCGTRLADENETKKILNEFFERSEKIKDEKFLKTEYSKFAQKHINYYLQKFHGTNIFFKIINKISRKKFTDILYSKKDLLNILNFIECEAHRELLIYGLKEKIKKK